MVDGGCSGCVSPMDALKADFRAIQNRCKALAQQVQDAKDAQALLNEFMAQVNKRQRKTFRKAGIIGDSLPDCIDALIEQRDALQQQAENLKAERHDVEHYLMEIGFHTPGKRLCEQVEDMRSAHQEGYLVVMRDLNAATAQAGVYREALERIGALLAPRCIYFGDADNAHCEVNCSPASYDPTERGKTCYGIRTLVKQALSTPPTTALLRWQAAERVAEAAKAALKIDALTTDFRWKWPDVERLRNSLAEYEAAKAK